jgi:hypothetical protein
VRIVALADIARASNKATRSAKAAVSPIELGETVAAIRKPRQLETAAGI